MIHNYGNRQIGMRNRSYVSSLDRLKSCCHHSLRYLISSDRCCMVEVKKYWNQKDIGNYSDACINCLKSFSTGYVSPVKKLRKGKRKRKRRERNECMVCSVWNICVLFRLDHVLCGQLLYIISSSLRKQMAPIYQFK